jgi:hypothetical protein
MVYIVLMYCESNKELYDPPVSPNFAEKIAEKSLPPILIHDPTTTLGRLSGDHTTKAKSTLQRFPDSDSYRHMHLFSRSNRRIRPSTMQTFIFLFLSLSATLFSEPTTDYHKHHQWVGRAGIATAAT